MVVVLELEVYVGVGVVEDLLVFEVLVGVVFGV